MNITKANNSKVIMTSELRRRTKLKGDNVNSQMHNRRHKHSKKGFSIHTSLLCLVLSGLILTLFGILYIDNIPWHIGTLAIDKIAVNFGFHEPVYAVVIDAGSTGSRVLAFTFHESYIGSHLILDRELFKYNKVGLSSFAENPEDGARSIQSLIEEAKNEIPQKHWTNTSLLLKATAGLRLLPQDKAEVLLNNVRNIFKNVPFLTRKDSVEIMDGIDEGIYSWFTVNFLLGRINGSPVNTVAALDLGGGSTQVTFAALAPSSLKHSDRIHLAPSLTGNIPVYTHSFLGMGLKAARKAVLTYGQENSRNITSECVNHIIEGHKFKYGNEVYYVSGPKRGYLTVEDKSVGYLTNSDIPIVNMDKCLPIIRSFIRINSKPPEELPNKDIFAFSYYFDRAAEAGLIDPFNGGKIKLEDFKNAAAEEYIVPNDEADEQSVTQVSRYKIINTLHSLIQRLVGRIEDQSEIISLLEYENPGITVPQKK